MPPVGNESSMETIITTFQSKLDLFSGKDRRKIQAALNKAIELHGNQKRLSGEPYIIHPVSVASILIDMKMDAMTVMAALLHDTVEDTGYTLEELQNDFGEETARLVNGVTKISGVKGVKLSKKNEQEAESIRKMLIAMTQDIRVIIIKLADKLHNISTVHFLPPERAKRFARECLDIYAPLAERLEVVAFKDVVLVGRHNPHTAQMIRQEIMYLRVLLCRHNASAAKGRALKNFDRREIFAAMICERTSVCETCTLACLG